VKRGRGVGSSAPDTEKTDKTNDHDGPKASGDVELPLKEEGRKSGTDLAQFRGGGRAGGRGVVTREGEGGFEEEGNSTGLLLPRYVSAQTIAKQTLNTESRRVGSVVSLGAIVLLKSTV